MKFSKLYFLLVITLLLILTFEGSYLPLVLKATNSVPFTKSLLYLKYLASLSLFSYFILKITTYKEKFLHFELFAVIYLLFVGTVVLASLLFLDTGFEGYQADIARYVFPFLVYFGGRSLFHLPNNHDTFKVLLKVFLIVGFISILDIIFVPPAFWRDTMELGSYLEKIKGGELSSINNIDGLPGNFFHSPYNLKIRRSIGTLGDPLALAYACTIPFCVLFFSRNILVDKRKKKAAFLFLIFLAIILSLTRAVILSILVVILIEKLFKKLTPFAVLGLSVIFMISISAFGLYFYSFFENKDSSTLGHLNSLNSLWNIKPVNLIIGSLGGRIFGFQSEALFFESSFLTLIYNFGIGVAILLYLFISFLLYRLYKTQNPIYKGLAIAGTVGMLTSIIFSESFFSFTGFGYFWLLAGIAISSSKKNFLKPLNLREPNAGKAYLKND